MGRHVASKTLLLVLSLHFGQWGASLLSIGCLTELKVQLPGELHVLTEYTYLLMPPFIPMVIGTVILVFTLLLYVAVAASDNKCLYITVATGTLALAVSHLLCGVFSLAFSPWVIEHATARCPLLPRSAGSTGQPPDCSDLLMHLPHVIQGLGIALLATSTLEFLMGLISVCLARSTCKRRDSSYGSQGTNRDSMAMPFTTDPQFYYYSSH